MREFTHQIKDFNGLRKTSRTKRGVRCCSAVTNLVGRNKKLVTPENLTAVEESSSTWPFGQFFVFKDCLYCFNDYSLVKLLPTYEVVLSSLEVGLRWTGLILNDFALFSNGVTKVVYDPSTASFAITQNPWYGLANTMEIFSGQVFVGGIDLSTLAEIESRLRIAEVHYRAFAPHECPLDRASNEIVWGAAAATAPALVTHVDQIFPSGVTGLFSLEDNVLYCYGDAYPYVHSGYPQETILRTFEPCVFDTSLTTVKKIVTNEYGSAILTTDGKLSAVGQGACLGFGDDNEYFNKFYSNNILEGVSDIDFAPYDDTGLLLIDNLLYGAGKNYCNLLGDVVPIYDYSTGGVLDSYQRLNESAAYKAIAIGELASYAIREDGVLCTCGRQGWPTIGRGEYNTDSPYTYYTSFAPIEGPNASVKFKAVSAHTAFMLALSEVGEVYFCGWNYDGESGQGLSWSELPYVMYPTKVPGLSNIVKVIQGYYCCAALDVAGALYVWGYLPTIVAGEVVSPTLTPTKVLDDVEDFTLIHELPTIIAKTASGLYRLGDYIMPEDSYTNTFTAIV